MVPLFFALRYTCAMTWFDTIFVIIFQKSLTMSEGVIPLIAPVRRSFNVDGSAEQSEV